MNILPREINGVGEGFPLIRNWTLRSGSFFGEREIASAAKVCVIGQTIVEKLFQTTDPIGETIRIRDVPFTVVGVLDPKGASLDGQDQDSIVLAPYTTIKKRILGSSRDNVDAIMVAVRSTDRMDDAEIEVKMLLHERHAIRPGALDDFSVFNTTEIANILTIVTGTLTASCWPRSPACR
ncbi:MAG: ABC transporter permease [Pirellulales bacterium]